LAIDATVPSPDGWICISPVPTMTLPSRQPTGLNVSGTGVAGATSSRCGDGTLNVVTIGGRVAVSSTLVMPCRMRTRTIGV